MENIKKNEKFIDWARNLYDENCLERHRHGQTQHETFDIYYGLYESWLWAEYQKRAKQSSGSLYLS